MAEQTAEGTDLFVEPTAPSADNGEDKPRRKYQRRKKEQVPDDVDIPEITDEELLVDAGVEQVYSTNDVADFFDRSNQWLYWGLREEIFTYQDGTPINPERIGDPELGRRRFTLPIIKEILLSSYRRGNVTPDELKKVLRRIRIAELGGNWKAREGWTGRQIRLTELGPGEEKQEAPTGTEQ